MARKIFVNLAVRDLPRSKAFFRELGFELDARFTDDKAACLIVNSHACVMLLSQPFFQTFTKRPISDAAKQTEALFAISADSRAAVDTLVQRALALGGKPAMEPQDHGSM